MGFVSHLTVTHFKSPLYLLNTILLFIISSILVIRMVSSLDYKQIVNHEINNE